MLEIQKFLREGGTLTDLEDKYAVKAKRHGQYPNLTLFKYDQIESPFAEKLVQECRGIILDEANDWKIVSRAMDKFFNYGESLAAEIDWASAKIQEKIDGSILTIFPFNGQWHVQTSGMPDASGEINTFGLSTWEPRPGITWDSPKSFADFFWQILRFYYHDSLGNNSNLIFKRAPEINVCFFFEATSLLNRIVVKHPEAKLTLLGARDLDTQQELTPQEASELLGHAIPVVKEFSFKNMQEVLDSFATMDPLQQEGFVIVDKHFNRIKCKSPAYIALHHAKDGLNTKAFVEIARSGETSEVEAAFPEFASMLKEARQRVQDLIVELEKDYQEISHIENQKEFALKAVTSKCPAALFQTRAKKVSGVKQYIREMRVENLMTTLEYK